MHTPARASARTRAGTQKTDKQTRQTRGKENRLGLGAMILSIELPPKLPPLFALRPHPALPKCWRDGGVGAAMRRMAAVESEGLGPHTGREWLAARLADLLSAITRGEQVFVARAVAGTSAAAQ